MSGIAHRPHSVRFHHMPFGAQILPGGEGTRFRLWAPSAKTVTVLINEQETPLTAEGDGWFSRVVHSAPHGTLYQFRIDGGLIVPDPASRFQPQDVHGPSQVVDPTRFAWQDLAWHGRPWTEAVIYELHVGTFSPEGTFKGVEARIEYLARLGVTAIELMPMADFPGQRNWGYDGVQSFAPDSRYGTPDDLKQLIQTAHQHGLMVFLDVVYNHFGPEGNYLHCYAKSFFTEHHHTPWGAALNFEGASPVREFFIQNALYWLNEYHLDGLRLDAVHAIADDSKQHFLQELAETIRAQTDPNRHIHLMLENDLNQPQYLKPGWFNAQWNDDAHHAWHVLLSGEKNGYYVDYAPPTAPLSTLDYLGRCLTEGFGYQGECSSYRNGTPRGAASTHLPPTAFIHFLQNHDQIGNRAMGERLITLCKPEALRAAVAVLLLSPAIPLIFMGEEWQTEKPFLFFCDFEPGLAGLVAAGRREEFSKLTKFRDPESRQEIPDPNTPQTFEMSRLDWSELQNPSHADWLSFYQNLLTLRQQEITPWLSNMQTTPKSAHQYRILQNQGLHLSWSLSDETRLHLLANLSPENLNLTETSLQEVPLPHTQPVYESALDLAQCMKQGFMPSWSVTCWRQSR